MLSQDCLAQILPNIQELGAGSERQEGQPLDAPLNICRPSWVVNLSCPTEGRAESILLVVTIQLEAEVGV